jgi:hypothetical protein
MLKATQIWLDMSEFTDISNLPRANGEYTYLRSAKK